MTVRMVKKEFFFNVAIQRVGEKLILTSLEAEKQIDEW